MPRLIEKTSLFIATPSGEIFVNPLLFSCLIPLAAKAAAKEKTHSHAAAAAPGNTAPQKKVPIGKILSLDLIEKELDQEGATTPRSKVNFSITVTNIGPDPDIEELPLEFAELYMGGQKVGNLTITSANPDAYTPRTATISFSREYASTTDLGQFQIRFVWANPPAAEWSYEVDPNITVDAENHEYTVSIDKDYEDLRAHATTNYYAVSGPTGYDGYPMGIGDYNFQARSYDPVVGIWTAVEPAQEPQDWGAYTYCGNNPTNRTDPDGRMDAATIAKGAGLGLFALSLFTPADVLYATILLAGVAYEVYQGMPGHEQLLPTNVPTTPLVNVPQNVGTGSQANIPVSVENKLSGTPANPPDVRGNIESISPAAQLPNLLLAQGAKDAPIQITRKEHSEYIYGPKDDPKVTSEGGTRPNTWTTPDVYAVLLVTSLASAVTTSSEHVNPFTEFMNPQGGVDLSSGNAAFDYPLYTLKGRNGMGMPLTLHYSSNVYINARSRNDKAPTTWVGLGWIRV